MDENVMSAADSNNMDILKRSIFLLLRLIGIFKIHNSLDYPRTVQH